MGWRPGPDGGAGTSPDRDPGTPGAPVRDPRLDPRTRTALSLIRVSRCRARSSGLRALKTLRRSR
jgi:hypothetical protein